MGGSKLDHVLKRSTVLTLVAALVAASTSTALVRSLVIRGDRALGSFQTSMSLSAAERSFGAAKTTIAQPPFTRTCVARWDGSLGLSMRFAGAGCTDRSLLIKAVAAGKGWRTVRGLKVGDPEARIRVLYSGAVRLPKIGRDVSWALLYRGRTPTLTVVLRDGRVQAFVISPAVAGQFTTP